MEEQGSIIKKTPIVEEMRRSYIDYSMSVIVSRALPDVRDGLKPVQRRLIFAMDELGLRHDKPHKKSARPVAETMGKYHPHGEAAIYDALVRLSQPFNMRYPLVDGHGNFGSVDGDPAAAMRYTEARLTAISEELLADLEKDTVDFIPNFDESLKEPTVLPARIPSLMVNGSAGIAVGMATNIPPHNLGEVLDALEALIEDPSLSSSDLMKFVKGPDFPTGGLLIGKEAIRKVYTTGRGIMTLRARTRIETDKRDRQSIIVEELPYQVNKARLIESIAELVRDKKIVGITDLRDESDKDEGIRVVIEVRRDVEAQVVLNQLFKRTSLQTSFGAIMIALVNNKPETLDLRGMLWNYLEHRKIIIIRRTRYELKKAEDKAHILLGLAIALDNLDQVIALIRASANPKEALEGLMENFALDEVQAKAILEMTLQRLTRLERDKILAEREALLKEIEYLRAVLGSERMLLAIIKKDFEDIRESFADSRRTLIVDRTEDITEEDLIVEQDVTVLLTKMGYIKRMPVTAYRTQRRGGMGATAMQTREEDWIEKVVAATTKQSLLVFTTSGKTYWLRVYDIPEAGKNAKGYLVSRLIQIEDDERVTAAIPVDVNSKKDLLFVTKNGMCKRTPISDFASVRKSGIRAVNLKEGDSLVNVKEVTDEDQILIASSKGKALRMGVKDVRPMGRSAAGVIGMRLAEGDYVIGADSIQKGEVVLLVSELGYGKLSKVDDFPVHRRASTGVIALKVSEKSGDLSIMRLVSPEEGELLLVTALGVAIRTPIEHIKMVHRSSLGVRLMRVDSGDRLVASGIVDTEQM